MADSKIEGSKLAQSQTAVPICRIHVYNSKGQSRTEHVSSENNDNFRNPYAVPVHWAGNPKVNSLGTPVQSLPGAQAGVTKEKPFCVLGFGGKYINNTYDPSLNGKPTNWHVLDARVNLTRQWSCSSALFHIARELDNTEQSVGHRPPILPNDCIVIEMGYVKSLHSKINTQEGNTDYNYFSGDVVFYGVVDTIKERGGSGESDGVVFTIMCRDMMSFLVDNKMRGAYRPRVGQPKFNRAYVIRDMIYRGAAIDYIEWEKDENYQYIKNKEGHRVPITAGVAHNFYQTALFGENNCYVRVGNIEFSEREEIDITGDPTSLMAQGMSITDRFPVDVIKHFSLVETAPRELWADHRTGFINWMYRRTDARRLMNPKTTHLRQYFYRFPKDRANIISYTNEWSTAATITHFTITNPASGKNNLSGNVEKYVESPMADLRDPHDLSKPLRLITRNRYVFDDTVKADDKGSSSDAETTQIAGALFSIWGKAIETGMVMIQGDPSLEVGEAVQVFNTGLFGKTYKSKNANSDVNEETGHKGIHRVEALTHMFATGGATRGYTTTFIFGPLDKDSGLPPRIIKSENDLIKVVGEQEFYQNTDLTKAQERKNYIHVINLTDRMDIAVDTMDAR